MTSVLSPDDVTRITHEESLRREIRETMQSPANTRGIWKFANSPFFLLLMSAVLINWAGNIYQERTADQREREQKQEAKLAEDAKAREAEGVRELARKATYDRVTVEVSYRYSTSLAALRMLAKMHGKKVSRQINHAVIEALSPLVRPMSSIRPPLYPEYKEYSGLALIAELRRHTDPGESDNLKKILARTSQAVNDTIYAGPRETKSVENVASALIEAMKNPKWDNYFAYTDCPSDKPFC